MESYVWLELCGRNFNVIKNVLLYYQLNKRNQKTKPSYKVCFQLNLNMYLHTDG